jgi:uncharacterized membrane protein (TIGR02234 family)
MRASSTRAGSTRARVEFIAALVLLVVGAGLALIFSTRTWQTFTTVRSRPLADDVLHVTGRTIDAAPTALALIALAGVAAVIATRGWLRRIVGWVLALDGIAMIVRSVAALKPVDAEQARQIVMEKHPSVTFDLAAAPTVQVHPVWGIATCVCGGLIVVAGILIEWRGGTWGGMSSRYSRPDTHPASPADPEQAKAAEAKANLSMWNALERGDDPTE